MDSIDAVVVGAGVVGLAVARELALSGRSTIILESEADFGTGTSSRNSEVIHAGIYYPKGSLKARTCVEGRRMLYAFCQTHGVPFRRCGKLIVATDQAQLAQLARIRQAAADNGVDDLRVLSREDAEAIEPHLHCTGALLSPSTGIIDSHAYMLALLGDAQASGAFIAYGSRIASARATSSGIIVEIASTEGSITIKASILVNCAGLSAQAVAATIGGLPPGTIPPLRLAKGNYFALSGRAPFTHLVYPVPEVGGLGVHLTLDLGGQAKFGPDVEWIERLDYTVDPARGERFYAQVRKYWPGLKDGTLVPGYAGIRPKLPAADGNADFMIQGPDDHGLARLVNLYGIELPGLTASLAIARHVAKLAV